MVFGTGDTHIPIDVYKLDVDEFPEQLDLTKDDFVLIFGDFGGLWDGGAEDTFWLNWLTGRNFTTLFVDGNHENFSILNMYPVVDYMGGKAHQISSSIYHLMRGEVYTIDGKKFFTMGGAASIDKSSRKEGVSWWPEELPSEEEYQNAYSNLEKHEWNVDYIITHCCSNRILDKLFSYGSYDKLTCFFEFVVETHCKFTKWYFGHYHIDSDIDDKHVCLYNDIIRIV